MPQMAPITSLPLCLIISHLTMCLMAMIFFSSSKPAKKCANSNLKLSYNTWVW
nr:TPA_asm: ATP8 [Gammarus pulex]